jgi:ribonuclease Z
MTDPKTPSSPDEIQRALSGGLPIDHREGLMFEGINPTPGLKSAANWFPRTEKLGPDEIRIIFMGTAPFIPTRSNEHVGIRAARQWRELHLRPR